MDDIYLPVEEVDANDVPSLLDQDLIDAIDDDQIPVPHWKLKARYEEMLAS